MKTAEDVKKYLESKDLPDNFCIIPFVNIILGPGGDISVCRQKGTKHVIGNLKENNLKEIWNGEYLQKWRREFLDGKPEICAEEVKYVHCHLSPEQYWGTEDVSFKVEQDYPFKKLTANLNGECNLRCVMCDVWRQENGFYTEERFWKEARTEIFPYIKEIEMLSGEPLIQDDTFKLIDEMALINPEAAWSITTNGVWQFDGRVKDHLEKIKIKRFIFSIDSFDEKRYSKIRVNGSLETVLKNLKQVSDFGKKQKNPFAVTIHFLIMKDNFEEIINAVKESRKYNTKLTLDLCVNPKSLSIFSLNEGDRKELTLKLLEETPLDLLNSVMGVLLRLVGSLKPQSKKELLLKLVDKKNEEI